MNRFNWTFKEYDKAIEFDTNILEDHDYLDNVYNLAAAAAATHTATATTNSAATDVNDFNNDFHATFVLLVKISICSQETCYISTII